MQQLATITPRLITNTLTVSVAASPDTTQRALNQLDLSDPAIRAVRALGITDRITLRSGGLSWRPDRHGGQIDVHVDVRVAPDHGDGSSFTIVTRFAATDERTHERLLETWPVVGPLAASLVERAVRTVKHHAEEDEFDVAGTIEDDALAA